MQPGLCLVLVRPGVRMKFCWQASSAEQDYVAAKLEAEHREEIAKKAIEDAAAKVGGGEGVAGGKMCWYEYVMFWWKKGYRPLKN